MEGRIAEAIDALTKAIDLNPSSATALNARGYGYLRQRKLDLALVDISKAITLNPRYGNAYFNRAAIRKLNGDRDGAAQDLRQALSLGSVSLYTPPKH